MITSLDLRNVAQSHLFGYAAELPFFKDREMLTFEPGLTVLFGPNGCGKSTVLNMLALTMAAKQGGYSAVTEDHVRSTVDMLGALPNPRTGVRRDMRDKLGLAVAHDGQPVLYADPRQGVGLLAGTFDADFFEHGLAEVMGARGRSHGQLVMGRTSALLSVLSGQAEAPSEIAHLVKAEHVNGIWQSALKVVHARLQPTVPKGPLTVILDEPESNFSLLWQQKLWGLLGRPEVAENFQVIVASHSPFCLGIEHARHIDFQPGYRQEVEILLAATFYRRWGKPPPRTAPA